MNAGQVPAGRQASSSVVRLPIGAILPTLSLLALSAACICLSWGRLENPMQDQGWYLQVAARVAEGEVLYRDVVWMYGPLPVYILALLFRWLGVNVASLFLLYYLVTTLGCLLIYRVARFLPSPAMALLGTTALFLGGWWGGFMGYTLAYTGAVPLGAVLGLLFVVCLLSYLDGGRSIWPIGAGLATGGALLTKPEFALACLGTGFLILTASILVPPDSPLKPMPALRGLVVFLLVSVAVAGTGYGLSSYRAGWENVWAGFTGYDQDLILLREWPPWGTGASRGYIVSGAGLYLLVALMEYTVLDPAALGRHKVAIGLSGAVGLAALALPWLVRIRAEPRLLQSVLSSRQALLQEVIRTIWAPASVLLLSTAVILALRWIRCRKRGSAGPSHPVRYLAVLVVYSLLANVRSFLHPSGTFHFHYLATFLPILAFLLLKQLPDLAARSPGVPVSRDRSTLLIAAFLVAYGAIGLDWDLLHLAQLDTRLSAPRGNALYLGDNDRRKPWLPLLQFINSTTKPGDTIVLLGNEPGFYFWSERRNPLRQDAILPGMESGTADAQEMVARLKAHSARLIIVPQGVRTGHGWFWDPDIGRQAYADLEPVWQFVASNYRFRTLIGGESWGFAIYEPLPPHNPPIESP